MRILQLSWENFGTNDINEAFCELGFEVQILKTSQEEQLSNTVADKIRDKYLSSEFDAVFGFNYFPEIAKVCKELSVEYFAWVYDNPCVQLYSYTVMFPTNHIFVFDSDTYFRFANQGISTISFLPMAANTKRLASISLSPAINSECNSKYLHDISFVGSLYTEEHNFYQRMINKGISGYTEGYIRGLMEAQKLLYGFNIIEGKLNDAVINDMYSALPLEPDEGSVITKEILFMEYVLNRQITAEERTHMLRLIGKTFGNDNDVAIYTRDPNTMIDGCKNFGSVDFYQKTPQIFGQSKINLNISLRSIVNGMPLRCFEIMGSGGFLLTSFAGDFEHFFVDGEDYVSFESIPDMLGKIDYYLSHDKEREEIARNGFLKVTAEHTYLDRVKEMFNLQ